VEEYKISSCVLLFFLRTPNEVIIINSIIAATAELAAIGAASSATYHTATSGIVTFLAGAAAIGITFLIYKGISKSYGV
jgi:hypothetical protein